MKYALALTILMIADAVSTILLVDLGHQEVNPLMTILMACSIPGFLLVKATLGFIGGIALRNQPRVGRIMLYLMLGIAIWHILCWTA